MILTVMTGKIQAGDHRERQRRSAMRDQDGHRQHGVVMAAIAPAEDVDAVTLHLGQRRRDRSVIARAAFPAPRRSPGRGCRSVAQQFINQLAL
jgi:hypothetical protein